MGAPQPHGAPTGVTLDVLSLQIDHLQETVGGVKTQLDGIEKRLRSVEDDRLKAWTVVTIVAMFGLSGVAAFIKWIVTT